MSALKESLDLLAQEENLAILAHLDRLVFQEFREIKGILAWLEKKDQVRDSSRDF